jgi:cellulose synthase/poly-beta-1,6-N-acetylglucosamine synthase-like glycosyltransferase
VSGYQMLVMEQSMSWIVATNLASLLCFFLYVLLTASLLYHYLMLAAATLRATEGTSQSTATTSLAVVIPAHNEEAVIGRTVAAVMAQSYPGHLRQAYVIADYCTDATAVRAREHGAVSLERNDGPRGRKAYALRWGLQHILSSGVAYDGFVVIDADSLLDPSFLTVMNGHLEQGAKVLQGQHLIANPTDTVFTALADIDMRINNLLRNQAKRSLGLAGRLMGDAMCFSADVIQRYGWPTETLSEDREYGVYLALEGLGPIYVREAVSRGQAATRWKDATQQRLRWYAGLRRVRASRLGELLKASIHLNVVALDQLLELTLPPISVSVLFSTLAAAAQLATSRSFCLIPALYAIILFVLWVMLPILAMLASSVPLCNFRYLIVAPFYILWRIAIGIRANVGRARVKWVRTRRREEMGE